MHSANALVGRTERPSSALETVTSLTSLPSDARRRVERPRLGDGPAMRALREQVARYFATDETLLLTGPRGAGHGAAARRFAPLQRNPQVASRARGSPMR